MIKPPLPRNASVAKIVCVVLNDICSFPTLATLGLAFGVQGAYMNQAGLEGLLWENASKVVVVGTGVRMVRGSYSASDSVVGECRLVGQGWVCVGNS